MKKMVLVLLGVLFLFWNVHGYIKLLHEFAAGASDGSNPFGSLILSGSTLYGTTNYGGDNNDGTIFKIATNGTGLTLLHEFAGGANDGQYPYTSLILSGSTLYGVTTEGGDTNIGTIFKIETNGTGFSLLHEFAGGANDGSGPVDRLTLDGTTLYGMTIAGGDNNYGTIFKIETNGTGFTLLHEFAGGANDGKYPQGSLIRSGTTLYGMTCYGGDSDIGTIFKIATNGTGFTLLHEFAGGANDGKGPRGSLILSGTTLYGATYLGGDSDHGTIFKIETNGTVFTLLHEFMSGADDGYGPIGYLLPSGSTLYGTTYSGGDTNLGTIFKIETNGTGFSLLHEFAGGINDGSSPNCSLIVFGNKLYGMTISGGDSGKGTIFSIAAAPLAADFNDDNVTDLLWRHYAADGGNTVWLMSEATAGAGAGYNEAEGEGLNAEGKENAEIELDENNVGAELASAQMDAEDWQSSESALPEGEGMTSEFPFSGFPGPFGTISVIANVPLAALADLTWKIVGTGDFNGDNKVDIIWRYYGTGGGNAVWLMDGTNKTSSVALLANADLNWEIVGAGDFNSDLKVDILWRNKANGNNRVWLMNGLTRTSTVNLPNQTNLTWKIVGCGDFNGDGKTDILWRFQGAGGANQVWLMNGTGRQSIVNIRAETNLNWKIAGVGDFDKNGKADIIWRNYSASGANRIWIMNNTAYVRTETLTAVADLNWKIEN